MAQKRYWEYKADDSTWEFSQFLLGMHPPGVYRGFTFNPAASMNLQLVHTSNGLSKTAKDQTEQNNIGVIKTKQGVVIEEDTAVTLAIDPGDATHPRIDLIVCTHEYVEANGGATATYSVIKGTPAAVPATPALVNAAIQVIIGELYVPAATAALNAAGVAFTRSAVPSFANNRVDLTALENRMDNAEDNINSLQNQINNNDIDIAAIVNSINTINTTLAGKVTNDFSASKILVSDVNGDVAASGVASSKLTYIANITSDVQGVLDAHGNAINNNTSAIAGKLSSTKFNVDDTENVRMKILQATGFSFDSNTLCRLTHNITRAKLVMVDAWITADDGEIYHYSRDGSAYISTLATSFFDLIVSNGGFFNNAGFSNASVKMLVVYLA